MTEIPITKEENKIANEEALFIFGYLRKKYCNENVRDLDIVLNSLCFALSRLIQIYVGSDDATKMIKIITSILENNIKKEKA